MEEISFPRGGQHVQQQPPQSEDNHGKEQQRVRPSELKKKRKAAAEQGKHSESPDFLFGKSKEDDVNRPKSSKKSKKNGNDVTTTATMAAKHSLLPLGGGGVIVPTARDKRNKSTSSSSSSAAAAASSTMPMIEMFSFSKLSKGTKVLGMVREVQDEFAIISLPNLLNAYMLPPPGITSLKQCLEPLQYMRVVVQKVSQEIIKGGQSTRRQIQVSALPTHVNPPPPTKMDHNHSTIPGQVLRGQVRSIEDHGCLIDLGLGRQGFVKFDQIQGDYHIVEDETVIPLSSIEDEEQSNNENKSNKSNNKKQRRPRILQPGRLFDFVVATPSTTKDAAAVAAVVPLTLPSTAHLAQQITLPATSSTSRHAHTLATLQPGMLVTAKVEALAKNGVCVTFLGNVFRGSLELGPHLGMTNDHDSGTWRKLFQQYQHFPARILAIDLPTKLIRLSLAPHVLALTPPPPSVPVGTTLEKCTVVRVDAGIGALLALLDDDETNNTSSSSNVPTTIPKKLLQQSDLLTHESFQKAVATPTIYVHISKAYDDDTNEKTKDKKKKKDKKHNQGHRQVNAGHFAKEFGLGTTHTVRVLNDMYGSIDGVPQGGCSPSLLQAHVLTHADLQPGQLYHQVPILAKLDGGSVLVNLGGPASNPVRGLVPSPLHLLDHPSSLSSSDFRRKVLDTKFAVGAKIDVRVLTVDHAKKKCILTAKKSLVKTDDESHKIITSYRDLQVGQTVVGFISKLDDRSVYVTFCNQVYGRVTAKSLALELGIENPQDEYHVGDVVTCRVVQVRKSQKTNRHRSLDDDDYDDDQDDMEVEMDNDNGNEEEMDGSGKTTPRAFYHVLLSLKLPQQGSQTNDNQLVAMDEEIVEVERIQRSGPKQVQIQAGAILPEKSMKILELFNSKSRGGNNTNNNNNSSSGNFVPGYAIVSIKSKYLVVDESERSSMLSQMECKLPYDQLMDEYLAQDMETPEALNAMAAGVLRVGKKINQKAIVLSDPHKSNVDHSSGIGRLTVVSLRKKLIATMEEQQARNDSSEDAKRIILPTPKTYLFVGALVQGYVANIDPRHGAFLRFLDGMTGLIPRMNGGLDLTPYSTMVARVQVIDDTVRPFRIMLEPLGRRDKASKGSHGESRLKAGDRIAKAVVKSIGFMDTKLEVIEADDMTLKGTPIHIHATMKDAPDTKTRFRKTSVDKGQIAKGHPFYGMKIGGLLTDLTVVSVELRKSKVIVHVTDQNADPTEEEEDDYNDHTSTIKSPTFVSSRSDLHPGMKVKAVVAGFGIKNKGLHVMVSPYVKGFIPGLELTEHLNVLNDLPSHLPPGAKFTCAVMDDNKWHENRAKTPFASRSQKSWRDRKSTPNDQRDLYLSVLAAADPSKTSEKPTRNDVVIGRINKNLPQYQPPSLMLSLRAGFVARCCITELAEMDEWENMPLGVPSYSSKLGSKSKEEMNVGDNDSNDGGDDDSSSRTDDEEEQLIKTEGSFADGKYVKCRVIRSFAKQSLVEVSLRDSRLEGDVDDDVTPPEGETIQAYVLETNKKGCFVRIARHIEGRATLTELCEGFLPDPQASFPPGRLVVGKVKSIMPVQNKSKSSKSAVRFKADLDMRESTLLDKKKTLDFDEIQVQSKYKGTVTRIESYGVFVQIANSKVSGLVHLSECSDNFIKNLGALFSPGDPVKVLVIKKDDTGKKIGFSMKASHFENDEDSDDESSVDNSDIDDKDMEDVEQELESNMKKNGLELDSDDENFATKLAAKIEGKKDEDENEENDEEKADAMVRGSDRESLDSDSESDEGDEGPTLDTNVGFDWSVNGARNALFKKGKDDSSDTSESESDDEEEGNKAGKNSSHKSRKKQAQRRREEQEISKREVALADGTADENPETAGDFERLLAGNPNSSELWIRYMAFYLSLADIPAARKVADKALERIDFQEEREKLNVWTALLTLEHKYGTEESLRQAIDRACGQNNPKQVYLRVCEILDKDLSTPENVTKADAMYSKMCSKFKSKKKVWLAHLTYLVKQSRHEEAHSLLKRALLSLPTYKHAETVSKFAQLEFEFGSTERARTLFAGLLNKHPKRLDLFFVYVDKEVKFGSVPTARSLLETKIGKGRLSDKQVKKVFKKWYRFEEQHGDDDSMEHVKDSARQYVQGTSEQG